MMANWNVMHLASNENPTNTAPLSPILFEEKGISCGKV